MWKPNGFLLYVKEYRKTSFNTLVLSSWEADIEMKQQKKGLCNLWFSQGSAAYGPQTEPGPLLLFVNTLLLACSHTHLLTDCFLTVWARLSPCNR